MTSAAPVTRMLPNALHFSEFQGGYHGTCGETALATAMVCSTPQIESTQDAINLLLALTREMIALGWADGTGATTTQRLHDEAVRRGFHPDESTFIGYKQPLDATSLHTLLLSTAGIKPIVLEIARAGVLPGDEAGVQYHFICVVGITPTGYVVNDGDNNAIGQHLITYSWAEIEAAVPCGVLVLEMENSATMIPSGWNDNGSELVASNGVKIVGEVRNFVLANVFDPTDVPLAPEFYPPLVEVGNPSLGTGAVQFFLKSGQVSAVPVDIKNPKGAWRAFRTFNGQEEAALRKRGDDALAQVGAQAAEITSLEQQISGLQAQIAALKSSTPAAPAPLDPAVKNALSAALQLLQPQVTTAQDLQTALSKLP